MDILAPGGHPLHDLPRIDITTLQEVDFWTRTLGVSELELRMAVAEVGDGTREVRDYLGR